jgi:hypothetical protein
MATVILRRLLTDILTSCFLLGLRGEWHGTLTDAVRIMVGKWYRAAFLTTKVQIRYPDQLFGITGFGL